ncbi:neutral/alkaline non-lysosomal ceramidase C-terminal domain-containing protein [Nocardia sp. NPDC004123]
MAKALAARVALGRGPAPLDWTAGIQPSLLPPLPPDVPVAGHRFGDILTAPQPSYASGQTAEVVFAGAHPNNDFHTGATYFEIQQAQGDSWSRVFDDNDWCTELHWSRPDGQPAASIVTIRWTIPDTTAPGRYRIQYNGDSRDLSGATTPFTALSPDFGIT